LGEAFEPDLPAEVAQQRLEERQADVARGRLRVAGELPDEGVREVEEQLPAGGEGAAEPGVRGDGQRGRFRREAARSGGGGRGARPREPLDLELEPVERQGKGLQVYAFEGGLVVAAVDEGDLDRPVAADFERTLLVEAEGLDPVGQFDRIAV